MPQIQLNNTWQKVKSAGKLSTMRVSGGFCRISQSASGSDAFPLYERDQPAAFASNLEIWATGTGTLYCFESTPET